MDHRFSTLFFQPPRTPPLPEATAMSGALPDPQALRKRKSTAMKQLLRKLFSIPRQITDPLVKNSEPKSSESNRQSWSEFVFMTKLSSETASIPKKTPTTKLRKISKTTTTDSTVVVLPLNPPLPSFRRKDIFHKSTTSTNSISSSITAHSKRTSSISTRDSKFSSISSLPSLVTLSLLPKHSHPHASPGPSLSLPISELALLQSLIRKVSRQLKRQEYLTNHLAGNLVHIFSKKEAQIHGMKRLRIQEREMAAREVWKALNLLRTALDNALRAPSTPRNRTRNSSPSSPLSGLQSSSPTSSTTSSNSPRSSTVSSHLHTFTLPLNTLNDTTSALHGDLSLHSVLNSELKNTIYTACLESRWNGLPGGGMRGNVKGNINDRIMMHRFVTFVESRISLRKGRMGCILSRIESHRTHRQRALIRKSAISRPLVIESSTSDYSFDEKRPPPSPSSSNSKSKYSTDSAPSTSSSTSSSSTSPTITLTSSTPEKDERKKHKDGKSEWREEYLCQEEINQITAQITRFVGGLTTYGQLIEKTHAALREDLLAILKLIPVPVPNPISAILPLASVSTVPEMSPPAETLSPPSSTRKRITKPPPAYITPGTPADVDQTSLSPFHLPPNHATIAKNHLTHLLSLLTQSHTAHHKTYATSHFPLITLLPRNWITFSRLSLSDQIKDVNRHLRREKGQIRGIVREGLLLGMIRRLSGLIKEGQGPGDIREEGEGMMGIGIGREEGYGKAAGGGEGFQDLESAVSQQFEEILFHLKAIEDERRKRNRETRIIGSVPIPVANSVTIPSIGTGSRRDTGVRLVGSTGEQGEEKEWSSPSMKWRVFGLLLEERVKLVREMRESILRGRVGLSAVLVGVFEDVRVCGEGV
ncbi:hypothetical protein EG329_000973 [Mollisiaceae sp. DMI_Dod_QoI]|nr:hypothetical protein EG329_000973 [Helotiales sp. DMI_Dod_QoI]